MWSLLRNWIGCVASRRSLGQRGERVAEKHLRRKGYQIVARGARDRIGEIDLVAIDRHTVVFVEVKARCGHGAGHPSEAVDDEKQRRLTKLALGYLKRHQLLENTARFDVVAVTWGNDQRFPDIEHYVNAFPAVGRGQMFS